MKEDAASFCVSRKEFEVEGVDGEGDDGAREAYAVWEVQGLRMEETSDLDLRRCFVTCLIGSIVDIDQWGSILLLLLSVFHCTPSVCVNVFQNKKPQLRSSGFSCFQLLSVNKIQNCSFDNRM